MFSHNKSKTPVSPAQFQVIADERGEAFARRYFVKRETE